MVLANPNCICTPYLTVYLVISLPKIPYIHRICMVLANPNCICTPYLTVYLVISLPKLPYIHRICMVLANPSVPLMHTICLKPSTLTVFSCSTPSKETTALKQFKPACQQRKLAPPTAAWAGLLPGRASTSVGKHGCCTAKETHKHTFVGKHSCCTVMETHEHTFVGKHGCCTVMKTHEHTFVGKHSCCTAMETHDSTSTLADTFAAQVGESTLNTHQQQHTKAHKCWRAHFLHSNSNTPATDINGSKHACCSAASAQEPSALVMAGMHLLL